MQKLGQLNKNQVRKSDTANKAVSTVAKPSMLTVLISIMSLQLRQKPNTWVYLDIDECY